MIVLYLGPNNVMPLASIAAAVVGVILIFWRFALGLVRGAVRTLFRQKPSSSPTGETKDDPQRR
jgi:hypothetical protein